MINKKYDKEYMCNMCGEMITRKIGKISKMKFCSNECHMAYLKKKKEDNMITKICEYCDKQFTVHYGIRNQRFCSRKCGNKNRYESNLVKLTCDYCSNEYFKGKCKINQRKKENYKNNFCSRECAGKFKDKRVEMHCELCGELYLATQGQLKRNTHACSTKCRNILNVLSMKTEYTSIEIAVTDILLKYGIKFTQQYVVANSFIADFYLDDYNIIIEAFGDYWHGNKLKFDNNNMNDMQKKNRKKDKIKLGVYKKHGYKFFVIWENDINNDIYSAIKPVLDYINNLQQKPVTITA